MGSTAALVPPIVSDRLQALSYRQLGETMRRVVNNEVSVREVLTCPGCLQPFGATSADRYEKLRAGSPDDRAVTAVDPMLGRLPVVKPDPPGGYRCPRCGHLVA